MSRHPSFMTLRWRLLMRKSVLAWKAFALARSPQCRGRRPRFLRAVVGLVCATQSETALPVKLASATATKPCLASSTPAPYPRVWSAAGCGAWCGPPCKVRPGHGRPCGPPLRHIAGSLKQTMMSRKIRAELTCRHKVVSPRCV